MRQQPSLFSLLVVFLLCLSSRIRVAATSVTSCDPGDVTLASKGKTSSALPMEHHPSNEHHRQHSSRVVYMEDDDKEDEEEDEEEDVENSDDVDGMGLEMSPRTKQRGEMSLKANTFVRASLVSQQQQQRKKHQVQLENRGGAAAIATVQNTKSVVPQNSPLLEDLLHRLKVGFYFGLWYALNIVFNIENKKLLNVWAAPLTVGTLQLGVGALYAQLLWASSLRARPVVSGKDQLKAFQKVGLWHSLGQLTTTVSLGAGAVSFTHIVKALEPFFSAIVSIWYTQKRMKTPVYVTLVPVVVGVGYACLKDRSFSWLAFGTAMASNFAFALRAVLSKLAMTTTAGTTAKNLSSSNVFALVTIQAFFISIPLALLGEGTTAFVSTWKKALEKQNPSQILWGVLISGLFHYLNNEVMYMALDSVHPVTLAVGNTIKRVFIILASVIVFGTEITPQVAVGSAVGIGGVLLYSLTKQHYEKLEAEEKAAKANPK